MTDEFGELPVVDLPGSEDWRAAHEWGQRLARQFPGQDAHDLAYACENNAYGPAGERRVVELRLEKQGERDGDDWIWQLRFEDGSRWRATGWCDYTGWDCRSDLVWEELGGE
ncbi:MAG TPA: hypothetical protein VFV36_07815 [Candidatus Methylomirabilis sp.]|nr:hypothetical protein [Candidatus Methylomirabilis sp.]